MKSSISILSSKKRLEYINELNHTDCDYIHVDVMDGKFVDDTQFNLNETKAVNYVSNKLLDIHLMVDNPINFVNNYKGYKIEYITFHVECGKDINKVINKIHKMGYKAGLSIKPKTDIKEIEEYLSKIDLVLVMSVEPGKGGQHFLKDTAKKVKQLKKIIKENKYDVLIEVDGGINNETVKLIPDADIVVIGSYLLNGNNRYDYKRYIKKVVGK